MKDLYPFWKANIHEDRLAAKVVCMFPLLFFLGTCALVLWAVFRSILILLVMCAIMNVAMWLWLTSTCLLGVAGSYLVQQELEKTKDARVGVNSQAEAGAQAGSDSVTHVIVIPNYKEDEALMSETLESLAQAEDSHFFHIVLAMEAREAGSDVKAQTLQAKFKDCFAKVEVTLHPGDLQQDHNDGTVDAEVPGKASNLRWAVEQTYKNLQKEGQYSLASVLVTVTDADCIFHPAYFSTISKEFNIMRENPDKEQEWTMWQAPQLSYRNHWQAPICSRAWTYISSMYEFGGVSGLSFGGHHMVFSAYSLPLQLAHQADSWDGDIIAEDHHCYLKCFFYSVHAAALDDSARDQSVGCRPKLQIRPVLLPVKSTPIISPEGYWSSYAERWYQAKRHAQGVAELSYTLLAMYDTFRHLPFKNYSFSLFFAMGKILTRLFCMHLLPICQTVGLGVLTLYWMAHHRGIPACPKTLRITMALETDYVLCGLAGTWTLVWPVVIPILCLIWANYCFASTAFISPSQHQPSAKLWFKEDGEFEARCGSKKVAAFGSTVLDCVVFLLPMMLPYGLIAMLVAFWNVAFYGNRVTYVTASKQTRATAGSYGTMGDDQTREATENDV